MTTDEVIAYMERYFRRMYAIESSDARVMATMDRLEGQGDEGGARAQTMMKEQVARKKQVHREFWSRADDYWEPCSLSDYPDHDWERVSVLDVKSNGSDCFAFRYSYSGSRNRKRFEQPYSIRCSAQVFLGTDVGRWPVPVVENICAPIDNVGGVSLYDKGIGDPCEYIDLIRIVGDELKIVDHLF